MNSWHIRGDLHVHAHHTDCDHHKPGDPVDYHDAYCGRAALVEMRTYLQKKNFQYAAIVNHATDPENPEHISPASEEKVATHIINIAEANRMRSPDMPQLLAGVEVSIEQDGTLDVSHQTLCAMDIVILSRHGGTTSWPMPKVVRHFEPIFQNEPIHIVGHPTRYTPPESLKGIRALLELCARYQVAFELNAHNPFGVELIDDVIASGVLVTLGSDIHLNMLGETDTRKTFRDVKEIVGLQDAGLPKKRLINTWTAEELHAWLLMRKKMCSAAGKPHPAP